MRVANVMSDERIVLPAVPYSEGCEFLLQIDKGENRRERPRGNCREKRNMRIRPTVEGRRELAQEEASGSGEKSSFDSFGREFTEFLRLFKIEQ
jgi:hypothetical protein